MKFLYLSLFIFFLQSCKVTEKPEFKKVESVKVIQAAAEGVIIKTDVVFLNPNIVGGILQGKNIKVNIDNQPVAVINTDKFKVPAKKEFTMPILVEIPYNKVFKDGKQNLLQTIMKVINQKEIDIKYQGEIDYSYKGFHYTYPLNHIQKILIKS